MMPEIEKRILDELGEEIRKYEKEGKLYMFEKAMDKAMEKFKLELKERTEKELDNSVEKQCKKKLSDMRTPSKSK